MHPRITRLALSLACLFSLPLSLPAVGYLEVTLTDGTVVQGEVLGDGPKRLIIKVDGQARSISKDDIASTQEIEVEVPGVQWGPELPPPAPINSGKAGTPGSSAPKVLKSNPEGSEEEGGGALPKLKAGDGAAPADQERGLFKRPSHPDLVNLIQTDLVNNQGESVNLSTVTQAEYVLLYFSAHWCPPCRAFTPELVRFYKQYSESGKIEVIFVSGDKNADAMLQYMRSAHMPWLATRFGSKAAEKLKDKYAGPGIPCLVLLNRRDKVISDSYDGSSYRGPQAVLADLQAKLE